MNKIRLLLAIYLYTVGSLCFATANSALPYTGDMVGTTYNPKNILTTPVSGTNKGVVVQKKYCCTVYLDEEDMLYMHYVQGTTGLPGMQPYGQGLGPMVLNVYDPATNTTSIKKSVSTINSLNTNDTTSTGWYGSRRDQERRFCPAGYVAIGIRTKYLINPASPPMFFYAYMNTMFCAPIKQRCEWIYAGKSNGVSNFDATTNNPNTGSLIKARASRPSHPAPISSALWSTQLAPGAAPLFGVPQTFINNRTFNYCE